MPHGLSYFWDSGMLKLHVISEVLIAVSCFTTATVLFRFVRRRRDVPFAWMLVLFGAIIVASGAMSLMEVWDTWHVDYWVSGAIKAIAAVAWASAAILSVVLLPRALEVPNIGQLARATARLEDEVRERREAELDLRIRESAYREQADLLDLTHDAMFVRTLQGNIAYWNRAAESLYGWAADEVLGRVSQDLLQTQFPTSLEEIETEILAKGSWQGQLVHHHRNGSEIIVSSRWVLRRDATGQPEAILESNRDVTLSVREEKRFGDLLESAPDAMVMVDESGRIQFANAQSERLFGYSRAELKGQPIELLMPKRFHGLHVQNRASYSHSPQRRAMGAGLELYALRKDGSEFPVEISLSPLVAGNGTLVLSAIRDITERRVAEERIRRLNLALQHKVAEVSAVNKELETFSYSVSHDLRAPLRHIDGFTRILLEEHAQAFSEDARHYLDRILSAVSHMGHLVDDLLNLARIGRKEMARETVDLDQIVRQALAELPQEEQNREIEWRIEPLPQVEGDSGLLKLAFFNLLANAAKFTRTRQPAVIEIGSRGPSESPIFFVRDNGVGFDAKYADKLFGVFQRLHRQEDFEGTGIGLATVQRIIRRHGGEIRAEAAPDRGATFSFTLKTPPNPTGPSGTVEENASQSYGN